MRENEDLMVRIYLLLIFVLNFVCWWKYVFAENHQLEKFYLGTLILCATMTVLYAIWFFSLEKVEGK